MNPKNYTRNLVFIFIITVVCMMIFAKKAPEEFYSFIIEETAVEEVQEDADL